MVGVGGHLIAEGPRRLHKGVVPDQGAQDQVHVLGGGHISLVQAAGIGEDRAGTADGLGLGVHHLHKGVHAAAAHVVRHHVGRLVGGGQLHGVEQVAQRQGLPRPDIGVGGVLPVQDVEDIDRRRDGDGVQLILVVFEQQQHGHQLGQAGGGELGLAVLLIDHDVGVQIDHIDPVGAGFCCGRIALHGRGGQYQRDGQKQYGKKAGNPFFHKQADSLYRVAAGRPGRAGPPREWFGYKE